MVRAASRAVLLVSALCALGSSGMAWGVSVHAGALPAHVVGSTLGAAGGVPQLRAATQTTKKSSRKKTKQIAQPDRMPNGETVTNRERRLQRECKGRPNAGACLGYAS